MWFARFMTSGCPSPRDFFGTNLANFLEARLNEALAADAFACSVSAVCVRDKVGS